MQSILSCEEGVVVKLGGRRAPSLTKLPTALPMHDAFMRDAIHGCGLTLCWDRLGQESSEQLSITLGAVHLNRLHHPWTASHMDHGVGSWVKPQLFPRGTEWTPFPWTAQPPAPNGLLF
jgi:hypothetical protein